MELNLLEGNIVGIISNDYKKDDYKDKLVKDIIIKKQEASLKMVQLDINVLDKKYEDLSISEQNKVILASKLHDKVITLVNFSCGLTKKEIDSFKLLFKKIITYDKKVILIDKNSYMFLNCVDSIYVINQDKILFKTYDIFDYNLSKYIDVPKIVEFTGALESNGIKISHYKEIDDLLKAIYRIKA